MNALKKIGFWYEKLPLHLKEKHFLNLNPGEERRVAIDKQEEIDFIEYTRTRVKERFGVFADDQMVANDFLRFLTYYAMFSNTGKKVLRVPDISLKEALFNTGIDEMMLSDLCLPFNGFYVELGLKYADYSGATQNIEGAFVFDHGDWLEIVALESLSALPLPSLTYFSIFKDAPIKEQIKRVVSDFFNSSYSGTIAEAHKDTLAGFDKELVNQIVKLFSILFYLDYAQRELKSSITEKNEWKPFVKALKKGKAAQFNSKRITAYHYINLNAIKTPLSAPHADAGRGGHKQTKMTLVRGHWKRQPFGTKQQNQPTKTIWIKPYWKNIEGELGEELHIYKVK